MERRTRDLYDIGRLEFGKTEIGAIDRKRPSRDLRCGRGERRDATGESVMGNARVALPRGLLAFMLAVVAWGAAHASDVLPRLTRDGASVQLEVDGKPFLLLAGEIHNSSAS